MHFSEKTLANNLKEAGCQIFLNVLDKIDGAKDLVLSNTILVQLDSICGMQKLRQNAVDKVYKLQADTQFSDTKNRVYVIRTSIEEVKLVAAEINDYLTRGSHDYHVDIKFWIIFVPRMIHFCEIALEEEGIYEYVNILECPLGLIPIEYDVYSLEDDRIFKTLFLNKDITPLNDIVHSIEQLQILSGNISEVHGLGKYSEKIAKKMDEFNLKYGQNFMSDPDAISSFTDIYLIDRDSDFASVLLSQINYEGILDESFNISCNKLEFKVQTGAEPNPKIDNTSKKNPSDKNNPQQQIPAITYETVKHSLNRESDPIFRDIRDNHFSTVFSLVKTKSNEMRRKYNSSKDLNISSLKNFVANDLKNLQMEYKCLSVHISACEEIMKERNKYDFSEQLRTEQNIIDGIEIKKCLEYISKMMTHQLHAYVPLRLLSLLSLTQGGILPKDYRKFHTLYCENYGIFNNATFANLKKLGLIAEMDLTLANRLASLTGGLSSFTERASGRVASVLPRRGNLNMIMKKFQLVPEISELGYNFREPKDPAFVFGGTYIPLVCQLVSHVILNKRDGATQSSSSSSSSSSTSSYPSSQQNNLNITPELLKLLPHTYFRRRQTFLNNLPTNTSTSRAINDLQTKPGERALLLYFIGGVTYAEVSALRFVAKQRKVKIAIATTSIINGNKLIDSLFPIDRI